jgi:hypothetical protein
MGFFRILAAIPGFFLSSFILMILWGTVIDRIGIDFPTISYVTSMLITIVIWLVVAPLAAAPGRKK